jgi:hypothetical protein
MRKAGSVFDLLRWVVMFNSSTVLTRVNITTITHAHMFVSIKHEVTIYREIFDINECWRVSS